MHSVFPSGRLWTFGAIDSGPGPVRSWALCSELSECVEVSASGRLQSSDRNLVWVFPLSIILLSQYCSSQLMVRAGTQLGSEKPTWCCRALAWAWLSSGKRWGGKGACEWSAVKNLLVVRLSWWKSAVWLFFFFFFSLFLVEVFLFWSLIKSPSVLGAF